MNSVIATLYVVDATTYAISSVVLTAGLFKNDFSAYCPTNDTMWITNNSNPQIFVIDCSTNAVTIIVMTPFLPIGDTSLSGVTYNSKTDQIIVCSENYAYTFSPNDIVPSSTTAFGVGVTGDCKQLEYIPNVDRYGFLAVGGTSKAFFLNNDFTLQSVNNAIVGSPFPFFAGLNPNTNSLYLRSRGIGGISQFEFEATENAISFSDVDSYNFFNQGLRQDNKKVSCVKVVSSDQSQLVNNFDVLKIDANGKQNQEQLSPIVKVDTFQQQGDRALIITDDLILDGQTQFSQYLLNGNQSVNLLVYYAEVKRSDFLTGKKNPYLKPVKVKPIDWVALAKKFNKDKIKAVEKCKELQIQITNTTATDSQFNLFQAFENQLITNTPSVTFGDIDAYNFIVAKFKN